MDLSEQYPKTSARFDIIVDGNIPVVADNEVAEWADRIGKREKFDNMTSGKTRLLTGWYAWDVEFYIGVLED